jgi:DNA-binding GntR family transcriptional regulator
VGLLPLQSLESVLALPESRGLSVDIAERLRGAILSGYFGPGERLGEELLARSMGVSRGPVREALVQLEREGLVVIRRNRGAFVAQLSREDLEEVQSLRLVIEPLAVRRAILYASAQELDELQRIVDAMVAMDPEAITEHDAADLDIRFHDLIYRAAKHRRLYDCWSNLRPQIHIVLLNRNVAHEDFREYLVTSHQQIADSIRTGDELAAVAIIEDHLKGSYERVVQSYERRTHRDQELEGRRGESL